MTSDDVLQAVRHCTSVDGIARSEKNPANFIKDLIRKTTASNNWPSNLKALRYTAVQKTGKKKVFEFVPYAAGQTEPFPDPYKLHSGVQVYAVQSLSMLNEAKMLGRKDEAWLVQTAVNLRVVETHFALVSPLKSLITDLIHLQMSLKLRLTEVDAIYLARYRDGADILKAGITCEAKQADERVLENQLVEQAKAAFTQAKFDMVVPIALRAVTGKGIYVAEFDAVQATKVSTFTQPVLVAEAFYELSPTVPGI